METMNAETYLINIKYIIVLFNEWLISESPLFHYLRIKPFRKLPKTFQDHRKDADINKVSVVNNASNSRPTILHVKQSILPFEGFLK